MIKPITPDEIAAKKLEVIPQEIIEVVNKRIAISWTGDRSDVKIIDLIPDILAALPELTRQDIFDRNYLEIEDIYRQAGWKVTFNRPDYTESYDSYFTFERPK